MNLANHKAGDPFQCANCNRVYCSSRNGRDAMIDSEIIFDREYKEEEMVVICDDCWRILAHHMGLPIPQKRETK